MPRSEMAAWFPLLLSAYSSLCWNLSQIIFKKSHGETRLVRDEYFRNGRMVACANFAPFKCFFLFVFSGYAPVNIRC